MKLQILSLFICYSICSHVVASSSSQDINLEENETNNDDDGGTWEYIKTDSEGLNKASISNSSESSWLCWASIGISWMSQTSSSQKPQSADLKVSELASVFNCKSKLINQMNIDNLKVFGSFHANSHKDCLLKLIEIGDRDLFELYFRGNSDQIFNESSCSNDIYELIILCIKINSLKSFITTIINQTTVSVNGPEVIVLAGIYGSSDILQHVITENECLDYDWEWRNSNNISGSLSEYGIDSFSASIFLSAIKSIENDHLSCLNILINSNLNTSCNNFQLLTCAAKSNKIKFFEIIYNSTKLCLGPSSNDIMNRILQISIQSNNEELTIHLLSLNHDYNLLAKDHCIAGINTKNWNILNLLLSKISLKNLKASVLLDCAISSENDEIFVLIIKHLTDDYELSNLLIQYMNDSKYHPFVPLIIENRSLTFYAILTGLITSVRIESVLFMELLLGKPECMASDVRSGFLTALDSNNSHLILPFMVKFRDPRDLLLLEFNSDFPNLIEYLFRTKRWNSLEILTENFFQFPIFPRNIFMQKLLETDQVSLALTALRLGGIFPKGALLKCKYENMRQLLINEFNKDLI